MEGDITSKVLEIDEETRRGFLRRTPEEQRRAEIFAHFLKCGVAPNLVGYVYEHYNPVDGKVYLPGKEPFKLRRVRFHYVNGHLIE